MDTVFSPAVLSFIRDVYLETIVDDFEALDELKTRLLTELITNPNLSTISTNFRNEVLLMVEIVDNVMIDALPALLQKEDYDNIEDVIGSSLENKEGTTLCKKYITSKQCDKKPELFELMIGRLIGTYALDRIRGYAVSKMSNPDDGMLSTARQLCKILCEISKTCFYERTSDKYLHQVLRTKLHTERCAVLSEHETPLRHIPIQFPGDETEPIVRPFVKISAKNRSEMIDWEMTSRVDDFVFAIGILQESIDGADIRLYSNSMIPFHEQNGKRPQLFTTSSNFPYVAGMPFGVVCDRKLTVFDDKTKHLVCVTLVKYLQMIVDYCEHTKTPMGTYKDLLECCENPDKIPPANPFFKYI